MAELPEDRSKGTAALNLTPHACKQFRVILRALRVPHADRSRGNWRRAGRPSVFFTVPLALLHRPFQLFLVIIQQAMDLAMCLVADGVNLPAESLARGRRILIEHRLNFVVVFLEQSPDLLPLFRG
jgi:hypothetical protein